GEQGLVLDPPRQPQALRAPAEPAPRGLAVQVVALQAPGDLLQVVVGLGHADAQHGSASPRPEGRSPRRPVVRDKPDPHSALITSKPTGPLPPSPPLPFPWR